MQIYIIIICILNVHVCYINMPVALSAQTKLAPFILHLEYKAYYPFKTSEKLNYMHFILGAFVFQWLTWSCECFAYKKGWRRGLSDTIYQ